jgi:hypothetical protein
MEEARAEAAEVLRIDPQFSVERYARTLSFKNPRPIQKIIENLYKTGLE